MSKVKEAIKKEKTKEGLPKEAFAIVGDPEDSETWKDRGLGPYAGSRRRPQPRWLSWREGPGIRGRYHQGRSAFGPAL
jgi:hypothetical protein